MSGNRFNMKRLILLTVFSLVAALGFAGIALALDPPHSMVGSCQACHNNTAQNTPSYGGIDNTPLNQVCTSCHYSGGPADAMVTHSSTNAADRFGSWSRECVDCHDPHSMSQARLYNGTYVSGGSALFNGTMAANGAGTNSVTVSGSYASGSLVGMTIQFGLSTALTNSGTFYRIATNNLSVINVEGDGTWIKSPYVAAGHSYAISDTKLVRTQINRGVPVVNSNGDVISGNWANVKFLNETGPYSEVSTGNKTTSVCVVCHTETAANNIGYEIAAAQPGGSGADYDTSKVTAATEAAHATSDSATCWGTGNTGCHKDPARGFVAGCTDCHGKPPTNVASLVNTDVGGTTNTTGAASAGAHVTHVDKYGSANCDMCHTGGMPNSNFGDNVIEVNFNGTTAGMPASKLSTGQFNPGTWNANGFTVAGMTAGGADDTCTTLYCHSNAAPIDAANAYAPKDWFTGSISDCTSCHGNKADPSAMSKTHTVHLMSNSGIKCYNCHAATVNNVADPSSDADLAAGANHVNGVKTLLAGGTFANSAGVQMPVTFTATGSPSNCSNVSCHAGTGIGSDQAGTAIWNGSGATAQSASCNDCHSDIVTRMASGTHRHIAPAAYSSDAYPTAFETSCLNCHAKHNDNASSGDGNAYNLRATNATSYVDSSSLVNSDYNTSGGGFCLSCHQNEVVGNSHTLPAIEVTNATQVGAVHMYKVGSSFTDGSYFGAVCVKCHNDQQASAVGAQNGSFKFSPHQSSNESLLINTDSDSAPDSACVACHSTGTELYLGNEAPDVSALLNASASNNGLGSYASGHPVGGAYATNRIVNSIDRAEAAVNPAGTRFVACADCHNVHGTQIAPRHEAVTVAGDSLSLTDTSRTLAATGWVADQWKGYLIVMESTSGDATVKNTRYVRQVTGSTTDSSGTVYTFGLPFTPATGKVLGDYTAADWKYEVRKLDGSMDPGMNGAWGVAVSYNPAAAMTTAPSNDTVALNYSGTSSSITNGANALTVVTGTFSSTTNLRGMSLIINTGTCGATATAGGTQYPILDSDATTVTLPSFTACTPAAGNGYQILDVNNNVVESGNCSATAVKDPTDAEMITGQAQESISTGVSGCSDPTKDWAFSQWSGYKLHWTSGACATANRDEIIDWNLSNGVAFAQKTSATCAPSTGDVYLVAATGLASDTFADPSAATYTVKAAATNQRDVCVKCHSYYAFGNTPPDLVSGGPNKGNATWEGKGTDIAQEFNPNNLAHHAVYAVGQNQPLPTDGSKLGDASAGRMNTISRVAGTFAANLNPQWYGAGLTWNGSASGGTVTLTGQKLPNNALPGWYVRESDGTWYQITQIIDDSTFKAASTDGNPWDTGASAIPDGTVNMVTPGLGDTFVPPYGPWAQINCSDCHGGSPEDPQGPHVSDNRWIMKDADTELRFEAMDTINVDGTHATMAPGVTIVKYGVQSGTRPGAGTTVAENDDTEMLPQYLCYNCHRADVYGTAEDEGSSQTENFSASGLTGDFNSPYDYKWGPRNNKLSRQPHGATTMYGTAHCYVPTTKFAGWGIFCKECHLGEREGAVHGTNAQNQLPASWMNTPSDPGYDSNPIAAERPTCIDNGAFNNTSCTSTGTLSVAASYGGDHSLAGFSFKFNEDTDNNCYATSPVILDNIGQTVYFTSVDTAKAACTTANGVTFNLYARGMINATTGDYTGVATIGSGTCVSAAAGVCNTTSLGTGTLNQFAGDVIQFTNGTCNGVSTVVSASTAGATPKLSVATAPATSCKPRSAGYADKGLIALASGFSACENTSTGNQIYNCTDPSKNFGGGANALAGKYIGVVSTSDPVNCSGASLQITGNGVANLLVDSSTGNVTTCNVSKVVNYVMVGANRPNLYQGGHVSKNQGKRFLNGGGWSGVNPVTATTAVDRNGTSYQGSCYSTPITNNNVSNCGSAHGPATPTSRAASAGHGGTTTYANPATYDYDAN